MSTSDNTPNPLYKQCLNCGNLFRVKPSHYDIETYCSKACLSEHYKTRMVGEANPNYSNASERVCVGCGVIYHSYNKTRKYCSHACYVKHTHPDFIKKPTTKRVRKNYVCAMCGEKTDKRHKYCGNCSPYGKHTKHICQVCGTEFKHYADRKTCSKECSIIWRSICQQGEKSHLWKGGLVPYHQHIRKMPGYSDWRRKVFERDDFTCQLCSQKGGKLAAHHIKLFSENPELRTVLENGITLCWSCHAKIKNKETEYEEYFYGITRK